MMCLRVNLALLGQVKDKVLGISNVFKAAARQSLSVLVDVPLVNRALYGASLYYIDQYNNYSYDFYKNGEFGLVKACSKIFVDGSTVIFDVGANVGDWTADCRKFSSSAKYFLFEMSEETFETLRERFGGDRLIALENVALGQKDGRLEYKFYGSGSGSNSLVTNSDFKKSEFELRSVEVKAGDGYCSERGIDKINLLKIDTEGNEYDVLMGFRGLLEEKRIDVIQFEYGYANGDAGHLMKDFFVMLNGCGYSVGPLRRKGVLFKEFSYSDNNFRTGPNYVACLSKFVPALSSFS